MRSRVLTMLLTTAVTAGSVAVAAPARADVACSITGFSPRTVVVGARPVTKNFSVSTSGCDRQGWSIMEADFDFFVADSSPQHTFNPWDNSEAGRSSVIVDAYNSDFVQRERTFADGFTLLRATQWQSGTFNAGPEPVRRGGKVTVTGRLIVVDWRTDRYVPHAGQPVDVQFRTATGSYRTVASGRTGSDGSVRIAVTAPGSGVWRLSYAGNGTTAPATVTGDTVAMTG